MSAAAAPAPAPAPDRRSKTKDPETQTSPAVFISHSNKDKPFARQLVMDLRKDSAPVELWLDEEQIEFGNPITRGVSEAIDRTDYLLLLHSRNSAGSNWVQEEVAAATNLQINGGGIVVIAAVLDDTPMTSFLNDRLWIDFKTSYKEGYEKLLAFFRREASKTVIPPPEELRVKPPDDDCPTKLGQLSLGQLRQRMQKRLDREEVGVVWFDVFFDKMDNYVPGKAIDACLVELLTRCKRQDKITELLRNLCDNWPHVAAG